MGFHNIHFLIDSTNLFFVGPFQGVSEVSDAAF
jgi:hypothetical protein